MERERDEISILLIAAVLLRWRRTIIALAVLGGIAGVSKGLWSPRLYTSTAVFVPQSSESAPSELAAAASQLGFRVPSGGSAAWGPATYVALLRSRTLLEPIAFDTVTVVEENNRRVALMDLLKIPPAPLRRRVSQTVDAIEGIVSAGEERMIGAVKVSVRTRWPSVSLALAESVLQRVNEFNLETRKSQAAAERKFVEVQTVDAMVALRSAENALQTFLTRNRAIGPEQAFERDRLQREVGLRQELYTSWMKSREDARIREIRDTPVITILEPPTMPFVGEPRRSVRKGILGGLAGAFLGVLLALVAHALNAARKATTGDAQLFFSLLDEAKPRFLKRRSR